MQDWRYEAIALGGGGGPAVWPSGASSEDLLRRAQSEVKRSSYEADSNGYFQDLLIDFNSRDDDQIRTHLDTIQQALTKDIEGAIQLVYGGSVKKHTYVDGLSDIDLLAIINESNLVERSPQSLLKYFAGKLRERLPNTEIKVGNLAVTVEFSGSGFVIQILPALRTQKGVTIASSDGVGWSSVIRPDSFASKLSSVNQQNLNRVIPVIKLAKAINSQLPKEVQLSGYHIESIGINAFQNYGGKMTYKDMLLHLFDYASTAVLAPIKDKTGQSVHVDDYMGDEGSLHRQKAGAALSRVTAKMKLADSEASLDRWKQLIGE